MYFLSLILACQDSIRTPSGAQYYDSSLDDQQVSPSKDHLEHNERGISLNTNEQIVLSLINEHREYEDLNSLDSHSILVQVAREHSQKMAHGILPLGHDGFEHRTEYILDKFEPSFYDIAENVAMAYGEDASQDAVEMWIESEGHRDNIEGPYSLSGIGSYQIDEVTYFTQIFLSID
jgi:uncharacterized protein YkwD